MHRSSLPPGAKQKSETQPNNTQPSLPLCRPGWGRDSPFWAPGVPGLSATPWSQREHYQKIAEGLEGGAKGRHSALEEKCPRSPAAVM